MSDLFPTYGSIIKLKTKDNSYDELLFFVDKIEESYIKLISNNGMKPMIFDLNEDRSFVDGNITGIDVLYQPEHGYATQNKLVVGKNILLLFNDKVELDELEGTIIDLNEDMIIVEIKDTTKKIYIDFEYSGLLDKYNIQKIKIKSSEKNKKDYFIDLKNENIDKIQTKRQEKISEEKTEDEIIGIIEEDEDEEGPLLVYSLDQQVDDYIERNFKKKQPKKKIRFEVKRYLELIDNYVDMKNGIKIKKLPTNQITDYFLYNNSPLLIPASSYGYSEKYVKPTDIASKFNFFDGYYNLSLSEQSEYKILLKEQNDLYEELINEKYSQNNLDFSKQKKEDFHKRKGNINNKLYLFEDNELIDETLNYYGVHNGKLNQIDSYYINAKNVKTYVDGYVIPSRNAFMNELNTFKSSNIISKSIQNEYNNYILKNQNINKKTKITNVCELYGPNPIYIPLNETHDKLRKYLNDLNLKLSNVYKCFYNKNHKSFYHLLQQLNIFGINEIHYLDYKLCRHLLRENINIHRSRLNKENKSIISQTNEVPFHVSINENMYDKIISLYYNVEKEKKVIEKKHLHELFEATINNNHELLLFSLFEDNQNLQVEFSEDEEIAQFIEEVNASLQSLSSIENRSIPIVKKYTNLQEMMNDHNKIILKQDDSLYKNVYDYLYAYLSKENGYNETVDVFMKKLNQILESNDLTDEKHKELFENGLEGVYNTLIPLIIKLKVNKNERCYVVQNKNYYIYDGNKWITEEDKKEKIRKKRILKITNREESFDDIKENIVKDYIIDLINKVESEQIVKLETRNFEYITIEKKKIQDKHFFIKKTLFNNLFKYNNTKEELINEFKQSDYLINIVKSPYENLLLNIIGLEDEDVKYKLIPKFITKYTDGRRDDKSWLFCKDTGVKLIPKYLEKLASAYELSYKKYEEILNKVCREEGTINETNDAWIHIESGYYLKSIDFDINNEYDGDGNIIIINEPIPDEGSFELITDEDEAMMDYDDIIDDILNEDITIKIKKRLFLNDIEKSIHHYLLSFCDILGISILNEDKSELLAKEITNILRYGYGINAAKLNDETLKTYSILGFLLVYVQTKDIRVKKTFPGCNYSFKGFPLDQTDEEKDGIVYLACVLSIISKKNTNEPYINFKDKTKQEIAQELDIYIQKVILKNQYILNLITQKKNRILLRGLDEEETYYMSNQIELFKPSLYQLNIEDLKDPKSIKHELSNYDSYSSIDDYLSHISMKIQEFIYNKMLNQAPLLLNKYEQPQLKNFCCNNSQQFILDYILEKQSDKDEFINYLKLMNQYEYLQQNIKYRFLKAPSMNIMKEQFINIQNFNNSTIYNEEIIYLFFIAMFNFDNEKQIDEELLVFNINKPSKVYYDKSFTLNEKIKLLKENDYNFNQELLVSVIQTKYKKKPIIEKPQPVYEKYLNQNNIFDIFIKDFYKLNAEEVDAFFEEKNITYLQSYTTFVSNSRF